jgi:two-component system OmpR family response regulator
VVSVLVIGPDERPAKACRQLLGGQGDAVAVAQTAAEGLRSLRTLQADLVLFDVAVADMSADEFCRWLRADPERARVPVLFLLPQSALWVDGTLPSAYRAGEDGYLGKPFTVSELAEQAGALLAAAGAEAVLRAGRLALDLRLHELSVDDERERLTPIEFRLIRYLMERAGSTVPTEELLQNVWGYHPATGSAEVVRSHVANLRRKIAQLGERGELLAVVPRQGYRLVVGEGEVAGP